MDFFVIFYINYVRKVRYKKRINQKMKKMQKVLDKRARLG